jgi:hypothetical protein
MQTRTATTPAARITLIAFFGLLAAAGWAGDVPPGGAPPESAGSPASQPAFESVPFDSDRWVLADALPVEYRGRQALLGTAFLKDAEFKDGVIEVDVAVTGARSYPGVLFRMQTGQDYERVYIRPHRPGTLYPDTLQYVPAWHGIDGWQLYSGDGFNAGATIPTGEWFHLRLEVRGTQARLFIGNDAEPALRIHRLQRGLTRGTIGLSGPRDGTAWFSNFRYRPDAALQFDPPPLEDTPPGMLREWQVSTPLIARRIDRQHMPEPNELYGVHWQPLSAAPSGLVDISREFGRTTPQPECVLAKTALHAERDELRRFNFGYSDEVTVFLNGRALFTGNSAYRSRDPSFLGIIGLLDAVYLPLQAGDNELLLIVTENFGGWGFMVQDATAVYLASGVQRLWQARTELQMPESAAYDPQRDVVYVSNYDAFNPSRAEGLQCIARVSLDGQDCEPRWVVGLHNPTGLAVRGDTLWAVEPSGLVEIDIAAGKIVQRHGLPGAMMLNDVALAEDGTAYVSDSRGGAIYRLTGGKPEEWLRAPELARANGVLVQGGRLLVATNGDGWLKAVDLATKKIEMVANLGGGLIDGLAVAEDGSILASHNEGRLFRIAKSGEITKLLDTTAVEINCADFAYIPARRLIVAPTWMHNHVVTYRLGE